MEFLLEANNWYVQVHTFLWRVFWPCHTLSCDMYSDVVTHFPVTCNPISSVWPSFKNGWVPVVLKWFDDSSSCHVLRGGSTGLACWQCRLSFCLAKGIWSLVVHLLQEKRSRLCDGHNDKELYGISSATLSKNIEQCTVTLATPTQRNTQRHTLTHKHTHACSCKRNLPPYKLWMTMWTSAESCVLCWSLAFAVGCVCAGYSRRFNPNQYSPEWTPLCPISGVTPPVPRLQLATASWFDFHSTERSICSTHDNTVCVVVCSLAPVNPRSSCCRNTQS